MACHHPTQSASCVLTVSVPLRLTAQYSGCPRERPRVSCTAANQLIFSEKFLHMEQGPAMSASVVGISGPALFCQRKRKPPSSAHPQLTSQTRRAMEALSARRAPNAFGPSSGGTRVTTGLPWKHEESAGVEQASAQGLPHVPVPTVDTREPGAHRTGPD